jgi:hypothetical protein
MTDTRPVRLFNPGTIVATRGVMEATTLILRLFRLDCHLSGSWGCVDAEDQQRNDDAVKNGGRLLSAYPIDRTKPCKGYGDNCLWIITEADRSVTTLLLPDEY